MRHIRVRSGRRAAVTALLLAAWCAPALAAQQRLPATPEPVGGNLPAQRIHADDLIALSVYDAPELTRTVRVGTDGRIRLPMLKRRILADGLMPSELETAIADALEEEQILVDPVVTVTVAEYGSRPISVAGAVKNPITFQAAGRVTLLDALTRAGGLSMEAGPDILVTITQPGPDDTQAAITQRIAVKSLIDAADPQVNLRLHGGEEIRVPEAGRVFVVGNVKKPGAFPLLDSKDTTVLRVLALAEGLAPYASKEAYIIRRDDVTGARNEIRVELNRIMARKTADVPMGPNDILYVPDSSGRRATMAAIDRITGFGSSTASGLLIWRR